MSNLSILSSCDWWGVYIVSNKIIKKNLQLCLKYINNFEDNFFSSYLRWICNNSLVILVLHDKLQALAQFSHLDFGQSENYLLSFPLRLAARDYCDSYRSLVTRTVFSLHTILLNWLIPNPRGTINCIQAVAPVPVNVYLSGKIRQNFNYWNFNNVIS